jgi:carboxymethylenebutenolidase
MAGNRAPGRRIRRGAAALATLCSLAAALPSLAGEWVEFPGKDGTLRGYLALPEGEGPFPGLVVIHEWWGLNDHIKGEADGFARNGYAALAVDLYRGRSTADRDEAHELMRGLPLDRADADLRAAFAYLRAHPQVGGGKVGSVGWCMGGGYSLRLAQLEPDLAASVVYYGRLVSDPEQLEPIRAPVLGHFGSADRGIPVEQVRGFESSMQSLDKPVEVHVYEGAGHAFARQGGPQYDEKAAQRADARTRGFLREQLGGE